jgi:hypothetical protein
MATQPKPSTPSTPKPPSSPKPKPEDPGPEPEIKPGEDPQDFKNRLMKWSLAKMAANAVDAPQTIADEQRERSADIEKEGIDKWLAEHDERTDEQKKEMGVVAGLGPTPPSWLDSTRSTPEARAAQHPSNR